MIISRKIVEPFFLDYLYKKYPVLFGITWNKSRLDWTSVAGESHSSPSILAKILANHHEIYFENWDIELGSLDLQNVLLSNNHRYIFKVQWGYGSGIAFMASVPPLIALSIVSLLTQCSSMDANTLWVVFLREKNTSHLPLWTP